jgi:ABC-type sugar transport system substrate-binding protein
MLTWALAAGCADPAPDFLDESAAAGAPSASEIALVLPADSTFAGGLLERVTGRETGQQGTIFSSARPEPGDPPTRQAELVREAAGRRVSAVIVMPGDPQSLAPALAQAREQGVHMLVLGEVVPAPDGPPFPHIALQPAAGPAAELVAAAMGAAEELDLPAEGPAVIAIPENSDDPRLPARAAALRAELQRRGMNVLPDLGFTISSNGPRDAIDGVLAGSPRPTMILTTQDSAITAAMGARNDQLDKGPPFVIAGFMDNPEMLAMLDSGYCAAVVDGSLTAAATRAVQLAHDLIAGRAGSDSIEVPTPVRLTRRAPRTIPYTIPTSEADFPEQLRGAAPGSTPKGGR